MLRIYSVPVSLYCAKLRILLRHKELKWSETQPPGGYGSETYKKVVPSGNLPALVDGSLLLADSEAIAEYLEEKYPFPAMLPEAIQHRAKTRELSRFHDTRLEPEMRKLFAHVNPKSRVQSIVASQETMINERLQQLVQLLHYRLEFTKLDVSLGDCGYPVTFAWIALLADTLQLSIEWPQPVLLYRQGVESIPSVRDELDAYVPQVKSWIAQQVKT